MGKITKGKIAKMVKLDKELEEIKKEASDSLAKAKKNKDNELEIERGKVKEGDLWEEVYRLGQDCEAGKELKKLYPEVFELYTKQDKKVKEVDDYFLNEFGFTFNQITPARLIKLVSAIMDWKNE